MQDIREYLADKAEYAHLLPLMECIYGAVLRILISMEQNLAQSKKYLPWIYLGVFFLVTAGCYAVLHYVVPMGDDLMYGRWGRLGIGGLLERMAQHYQTANGRSLVHILDSILLAQICVLRSRGCLWRLCLVRLRSI